MVSLSTRRLQQVLSCVAENLAPVPARSFKWRWGIFCPVILGTLKRSHSTADQAERPHKLCRQCQRLRKADLLPSYAEHSLSLLKLFNRSSIYCPASTGRPHSKRHCSAV
jgi:hypothetical protein